MTEDTVLLKELVKMLVEVYGPEDVLEEAQLQHQIVTVDRIVRYMSAGNIKIRRIKAVRAIGIVHGLKEAKMWVEEHYPNTTFA